MKFNLSPYRIFFHGILISLGLVAMAFSTDEIMTISSLPRDRQGIVWNFAKGPLKKFSSIVYSTPRDFEAAIAEVSLESAKAFHSPEITEGFNKLGSLGLDVQFNEKEWDLIDAKDRLNKRLHAWGLHLVLDSEKLHEGRINLSAYSVEKKHVYNVLGSPFLMYEVTPLVEQEYYPALGHAEVDQGYLILFTQTINDETAMTKTYLEDDRQSFLKPSVLMSSSTIFTLDVLVRDAVGEPGDLRRRFVDTVGHHEGYHKYIEPTLTTAVEKGFLSGSEKAVWHETGAYLYQLESSNEKFTAIDLMAILATASSEAAGFYANKEGARRALLRIEPTLTWRGDQLIQLFAKSASQIKKAASIARENYELEVRNGIRAR